MGWLHNASLAARWRLPAEFYITMPRILWFGAFVLRRGALMLGLMGVFLWVGPARGQTIIIDQNDIVIGNGATLILDIQAVNLVILTGNVTGNGTLVKDGAGALTMMSPDASYIGDTTVNAGTFNVNVTTSPGNTFSVGSGATLGGTGSIGGDVVLNSGSLLIPGPGNRLGTLTAGNLTWNGSTDGSATMMYALSNSGNASSLLKITGTLAKGGGSDFVFDFEGTGYFDGVNVNDPNIYTLMDFSNSSGFSASDFGYTDLNAGLYGHFVLSGDDLTFVVVPEPAAWGLVLAGGGWFLAVGRAIAGQRARRVSERACGGGDLLVTLRL